MSPCLTLATQIYVRPQDRLYHVLVSPEFERSRDFFYPPKELRIVEFRDNQGQLFYKDTRYARVNLIHIPFVSIREQLSTDMHFLPCRKRTVSRKRKTAVIARSVLSISGLFLKSRIRLPAYIEKFSARMH